MAKISDFEPGMLVQHNWTKERGVLIGWPSSFTWMVAWDHGPPSVCDYRHLTPGGKPEKRVKQNFFFNRISPTFRLSD